MVTYGGVFAQLSSKKMPINRKVLNLFIFLLYIFFSLKDLRIDRSLVNYTVGIPEQAWNDVTSHAEPWPDARTGSFQHP